MSNVGLIPSSRTQSPSIGGVDTGALEREHLVAMADAALGQHDLPGRHLLEQREGVLEVGLVAAAAQVLDQERVRVEQVEGELELLLVGDLDHDVQAELHRDRLHLDEARRLPVERAGDEDDAVGAAQPALV